MAKEQKRHERERFSQIQKLYENYSWLKADADQEIKRPEPEELKAAASAISTIMLIDAAAGLMPGLTASQRLDAAKELGKLQTSQPGDDDPLSKLLREHGPKALLAELRKEPGSEPAPEADSKPLLE